MSDPASTVVTLVRHGRTEFNRAGIFRGRKDVPRDATGRDQAETAARILADRPFAGVDSSPLSRAIETAVRIAAAHGLDARVEEGCNNLDLGPWTGLPRARVAAEDHVRGEPGEREEA